MRVHAVDSLRGLSILYIVLNHVTFHLMGGAQGWLYDWIYTYTDVFGAASFIFIAGISMRLAHKRDSDGGVSARESATKSYKRSLIILGISFVYNWAHILIGAYDKSIWIWFVLQTIAVSRMLLYPLMMSSPWFRACLGFLIILLAEPVRLFLVDSYETAYFLLYNPWEQNTPLPFMGFFLFGSAIADMLSGAKAEPGKTSKRVFLAGASLVIIGVLWSLVADPFPTTAKTLERINEVPSYSLDYMPQVFVRNSSPWCLFTTGLQILILGLLLCWDFWGKQGLKSERHGLKVFGKSSLTIFLAHYAFLFNLPDVTTLIQLLCTLGLIYGFFYATSYWAQRGGNRYSVEGLIAWAIT